MLKTTLLFSLFITQIAVAQQGTSRIRQIVSQPRTQLEQMDCRKTETTVPISSRFAEGDLKRAQRNISELSVLKVYYVYTQYKQSASFNQRALDTKRLSQLNSLYPNLFADPYIEWEVIEQTACTSPEEGDRFFHGFVLVHRPVMNETTRLRELEQMEAIFKNPSAEVAFVPEDPYADQLDDSSEKKEDADAMFPEGHFALFRHLRDNISTSGDIGKNRDDDWMHFKFDVSKEGEISNLQFKEEYKDYMEDEVRRVFNEMENWHPAVKDGEEVNSTVNLEVRVTYSPTVRGMYTRDGVKPEFSEGEVDEFLGNELQPTEDDQEKIDIIEASNVFKGITAFTVTPNNAVVMDVTSSMNRHIASLNWWLSSSQDSLNVSSYTFFNDGDQKPNKKKKVGATGGIYQATKTFDVPKTIMEAMRSGHGGDQEENDIEAILRSQEYDPAADAILLIVDNHSDVRDRELMSQITKKVHVIVCGSARGVREVYLDLAFKTGGDVFVNEERLMISKMKAGQVLNIGTKTYRFDGSRFRLI